MRLGNFSNSLQQIYAIQEAVFKKNLQTGKDVRNNICHDWSGEDQKPKLLTSVKLHKDSQWFPRLSLLSTLANFARLARDAKCLIFDYIHSEKPGNTVAVEN